MHVGKYQLPQLLSKEDWDFCREVEAVLNVLKDINTLAKNEKGFNSPYCSVMRVELHKQWNSDTMEMKISAIEKKNKSTQSYS